MINQLKKQYLDRKSLFPNVILKWCKIHFVSTHNTLSFIWENASGCIDMMPFLLRSLQRGQKCGLDTPMMCIDQNSLPFHKQKTTTQHSGNKNFLLSLII